MQTRLMRHHPLSTSSSEMKKNCTTVSVKRQRGWCVYMQHATAWALVCLSVYVGLCTRPERFPVSVCGGGFVYSLCRSWVWVVCESVWPFYDSFVRVVGRAILMFITKGLIQSYDHTLSFRSLESLFSTVKNKSFCCRFEIILTWCKISIVIKPHGGSCKL